MCDKMRGKCRKMRMSKIKEELKKEEKGGEWKSTCGSPSQAQTHTEGTPSGLISCSLKQTFARPASMASLVALFTS